MNKRKNKKLEPIKKYYPTQSELADVLNVSKQNVGLWFNNKKNIPLKYAIQIEKLTFGGIKAMSLVTEEKKEELKLFLRISKLSQ